MRRGVCREATDSILAEQSALLPLCATCREVYAIECRSNHAPVQRTLYIDLRQLDIKFGARSLLLQAAIVPASRLEPGCGT